MIRRLLIYFLFVLLSVSNVSSQSFELSYDGAILNDTVYVYAHPDSNQTTFYANVKNISDKLINVKVARTNIEVMANTRNQVVFGDIKYAPSVDTTAYLTLPSGATTNEQDMLKGQYFNESGNIGKTIVRYSFYDFSNTSDHKDVVVVFWTSPTSVEENIFDKISFSSAYPNPATNKFNIDYNFDISFSRARLKIVNLLGSVVKDVEIDQGSNKLSMDISDLNAGVYFYSVVVNNDVFQTKKLVIR